jgi:hypothetical protein
LNSSILTGPVVNPLRGSETGPSFTFSQAGRKISKEMKQTNLRIIEVFFFENKQQTKAEALRVGTGFKKNQIFCKQFAMTCNLMT